MSGQANISIVKDFFEAVGGGDSKRLLALIAEDIEWRVPGKNWPLAGTYCGHAGVMKLVKIESETIEMSVMKPQEFVAQGNRVLVMGFAEGKVIATNKKFRDDWVFAITVKAASSRTSVSMSTHKCFLLRHRRLRPTSCCAVHTRSGTAGTSNCYNLYGDRMYEQPKLSELLDFSRVSLGSTVIDVYPGSGDWTRLFSGVVGPEGRVYSFVPSEVSHFKNDPLGLMQKLASEPGRSNIEAVSADLLRMPDVTQPADVLWLHLFYHDLHTALIQAKGATAAAFNHAVRERLKPGGYYVIVDHAAADGAGSRDSQSLHRIEKSAVRAEVEAAGFVLDGESVVLINSGDQHDVKVFDPSIKGNTDRFAYRFVRR